MKGEEAFFIAMGFRSVFVKGGSYAKFSIPSGLIEFNCPFVVWSNLQAKPALFPFPSCVFSLLQNQTAKALATVPWVNGNGVETGKGGATAVKDQKVADDGMIMGKRNKKIRLVRLNEMAKTGP